MNPIEKYYREEFDADLAEILSDNHCPYYAISYFHLLPHRNCCLNRITNGGYFLLCYFFRVLLSQAVHYKFRKYHGVFRGTADC